MRNIKKVIIWVLILGGIIGGYFGVRYQIKVYNTIVLQNSKLVVLEDFLVFTFPSQVDEYKKIIKAKQEGKTPAPVIAPLPTNPATK